MDSQKAPRRLYALAGLASAACCLSFLLLLSVLKNRIPSKAAAYNSRSIYENTSPVWDLGELPQKAMYFEPTVHYKTNSSEADAEWAALVPGGGIVRIGPQGDLYLVSMFHQLRCLDIIRQSYNRREGLTPQGPSAVAMHCLHYLRQTGLCRRDTRLEPVIDTEGPHAVQPWGTMTCKDWTAVYDAYARNQRGD
ncbi:hypothetical protein BD311DRAFT_314669 [Dichomitus squalens]|uniref:Oxidase ustYa n=1 Tax=Dichomitus squalens TaxID=114155 RepID=A0A4V2K0F7_9APHY|nr:hypothetical protein BD311DRAFT_314669 [Dichomitus squalens]